MLLFVLKINHISSHNDCKFFLALGVDAYSGYRALAKLHFVLIAIGHASDYTDHNLMQNMYGSLVANQTVAF